MESYFLLEALNRLRELPREAATVEFKSSLEDPMEIVERVVGGGIEAREALAHRAFAVPSAALTATKFH